MTVPDRSTFENIYAGQPPWDIGKPQKAFIDVADQITGSILDAGCGTGENALFFAGRGQKVTGIDFLEEPIHQGEAEGDRARGAGHLSGQRRPDAEGLDRAVRQRDRQRLVPRLLATMIGGATSRGWRRS